MSLNETAHPYTMEALRAKKGYIIDMDGVIYHGNMLLPGVERFVDFLKKNDKRFLFLTNSSERAPRELQQKLARLGLDVDESHFYTSAMSTAAFLKGQCPGGSVYAIGEPGLFGALYDAGFTMNEVNPDYVVLGETHTYNYEKIERAVQLVLGGAKLIGTNPDLKGADRPHRAGHRPQRLFSGQAQSPDDAPRPAPSGRQHGRGRHHRRPDGYRRDRGRGKRHRHGAGAFRRDLPGGNEQVPLPAPLCAERRGRRGRLTDFRGLRRSGKTKGECKCTEFLAFRKKQRAY